MKMNFLDGLMMVLLVVGGLNWGLVGLTKIDLVASVIGTSFGEVNLASQVVYTLVGVAAVYTAVKKFSRSPGA